MSKPTFTNIIPRLTDSHDDECIVYLESYFKTGDQAFDAYVDFRQEKDLQMFLRTTNLVEPQGTYLELRNMKSSKRLRRGCYYALNLKLLSEMKYEPREDSFLIGGSYILDEMKIPDGNDTEMLQTHATLDAAELSEYSVPGNEPFSKDLNGNLELFVMDVDQANWNELRMDGEVAVLYDAGARLNASKAEINSILSNRSHDLAKSKPTLIISHWDIDHVHCLKKLDISEIARYFSKMVCPNKTKSLTSSKVLSNFKIALGTRNVYCLPLPEKTGDNVIHCWNTTGPVSIYQCEKSSSINYCGLLMFVKGAVASANYTGDCRLIQACNVYRDAIANGIVTHSHILIAPHHGGANEAKYRVYSQPCTQVVISVGTNNSYGHPENKMLSYLETVSEGNVWRTDENGSFICGL